SMRRFDQMAERIRDGFPVGRRPTHDYQLSWREQTHTYSHRLAEDAYQRLASTDPTADAALNRDPETCPADLSDSIARLVERRAARGQSIGEMFTFAYRLPRPKGHAALRRAREVADRILAHYGDHLDARSEERRVGKERGCPRGGAPYRKERAERGNEGAHQTAMDGQR